MTPENGSSNQIAEQYQGHCGQDKSWRLEASNYWDFQGAM